GGLPFRTPAVAVHTVGAGGGSLLWIDPAGALRAGPASAGAVPGPACYGRGGTEPTVTDAHVVLGHLRPDRLLAGRLLLDADAARTRPMRDPDPTDVTAVLAELSERAWDLLVRQGAEPASVQHRIDCRYVGQAHEVPVAVTASPDLSRVASDFAAAHRARY